MTKPAKVLCRACRTRNEPQEKICHKCGLPLNAEAPDEPERKTTCPRCGSSNNAASFFCYTCGKYFAEIGPAKAGAKIARRKSGSSRPLTPKATVIMPGGSEITITGEPVFIERSDFNGTMSPELLMRVSRQHVLITYDKGKYYIKDYGREGKGSTNHTRLNGIDIHGKTRKALKDGDKIELAGHRELTLTFKLGKGTK
jgi:DNA-directed RNA polymerase subunit RPC12/RpoP